MNAQRRILCFMAIASLFATASFAQQAKTDYDRNADFTKYKTYSWQNVHTANALWVDRIKAAVNSALAVWWQADPRLAGDGPRPVRAGSCLAFGLRPEAV